MQGKLYLLLFGSFVIASSLLAVSSPAEARCRQSGNQIFYPAKGVGADFAYTSDNGRCYLNYVSHGTLMYTSARIVKKPNNGTLSQDRPFGFQYVAKKGFKGKDTLAIEVCGENMTGKGCSLLNYEMTIDLNG